MLYASQDIELRIENSGTPNLLIHIIQVESSCGTNSQNNIKNLELQGK
ncbi:unnamed protein product [Paramecium octaurelia]|uniref:Uncharacterized protein n=1 Tax=Paramecium octaurelia TaxID=43137 RepID=A0A8S1TC40_PAROT|nr:unnamed protein product [Paramecium octaurelia]